MDFNELITDFASRHSIEGLAIEDNTAFIDVDNIPVAFADVGDDVLISAVIGEPPTEGRAEFAELLLEANLESNTFFGKSKENGNYILSRRIPFSGVDAATFDSALEAIINAAETWRKLLEDFRPAAEAAAKADTADTLDLGAGSFMQV